MAAARPVVVVTGASAGVGRAVAVRFAEEGWAVGLLARGRAGLAGAAKDVEAAGGVAFELPCDVADHDAVEAAAAALEDEQGEIDVWVNSAMATIYSPFTDVSAEEYRRATEVTYLGTVWGTMAAMRRMGPRDRGTILQVGSALAYRAIPLQAPYCGAKFAIRGMTDSLRAELLHDESKVRVTMVQLPAVNTPQFDWGANHVGAAARPVAPVFQPSVAAEAVWRAASDAPRELWLGWRNVLTMVGGMVAAPVLDAMLGKNGFDSQRRPDDADPQPYGRSNLFEPVDDDEDVGMHGSFDDEAHERSVQLELRRLVPHPTAVAHGLGRVLARVLG
jgi:short-subunit dehydrogenase